MTDDPRVQKIASGRVMTGTIAATNVETLTLPIGRVASATIEATSVRCFRPVCDGSGRLQWIEVPPSSPEETP